MITRRTIALAATLGTLAALSRIPFAAIPNVQPASSLILLAGAVFGAPVGALTGALVPLVSNAFLGHGPWTLFQVLAWGAMGAAASVIPRQANRWLLAGVGLAAGLAYGLVMDGWVWLASVRPLAWHTLLPVLARGVPFNLAHGIGNAVILWTVGPRLATLLGRARARRTVEPFEDAAEDQAPTPSAGPSG